MITMKELAKELDLSIGTISLALNHSPRIRPETAQRVLEHCKKRGYRPSNVGRALQSGNSRLIGGVFSGLLGSFFNEIIEGIGRTCSQSGYGFLLSWHDPSSNRYVDQMLTNRVDGVVFVGYTDQSAANAALFSSLQTPVIFCSTQRHGSYPFVVTDDRAGGRMGVEYLYQQGHRKILLATTSSSLRLESAGEFLRSREDTQFHIFQDYHELPALLTTTGSTGIVFFSDLEAIDAMHFLRTRGIRVPEDVSIIGYDNLPLAARPEIELTTVGQQRENLGILAAQYLIDYTEKRPASPGTLLAPFLQIRKTVKKI